MDIERTWRGYEIDLAAPAGKIFSNLCGASCATADTMAEALAYIWEELQGVTDELSDFDRGVIFALDALLDTHPSVADSQLYRDTIKPSTPLFTGDNLGASNA